MQCSFQNADSSIRGHASGASILTRPLQRTPGLWTARQPPSPSRSLLRELYKPTSCRVSNARSVVTNPWLSTVRLPKLESGWSSSLATIMTRRLVMPSLLPSAVSARRWSSGQQKMAAAKHATNCAQWRCTSKVLARTPGTIGASQNAMANGSSSTTKESPRSQSISWSSKRTRQPIQSCSFSIACDPNNQRKEYKTERTVKEVENESRTSCLQQPLFIQCFVFPTYALLGKHLRVVVFHVWSLCRSIGPPSSPSTSLRRHTSRSALHMLSLAGSC